MTKGKGDNLADRLFGNQAAETDAEETQTLEPEDQAPDKQTEQPGEPDGGQAQQGEKDTGKLLAGKFKSMEELERAYVELERFGTQRSQEAAQLRRELEELRKALAPDMTAKQRDEWRKYAQQAIQKAVVDEDPDMLMQMIDYMIEARAEEKFQKRYREIEPVINQQKYQQEVNQWLADNPEASDYLDDMVKLVQAEPEIVTKPGWLDRAFARVLKAKVGIAGKVGAETAAKARAEKAAASMPGSGSRPKTEKKSEEDEMLDRIFSTGKGGGILG